MNYEWSTKLLQFQPTLFWILFVILLFLLLFCYSMNQILLWHEALRWTSPFLEEILQTLQQKKL